MTTRPVTWRSHLFTAGAIAAGLSWLAVTVDIGFTLCYAAHSSLLAAALADPWQRVMLLAWVFLIFICIHAED